MALSDSAGIGSALPSQVGNSGLYLTTDGTVATWSDVSGAGVTTMTTVGSSPNANGATISGANLTLQPCDETHPGVLTAADQTIGGHKTFAADIKLSNAVAAIVDTSTSAFLFRPYNDHLYMSPPNASIGQIIFRMDGVTGAIAFSSDGTIDLTGVTPSPGFKLKSPDGTTYTATIANGGTWSIT